MDRQKHDFIRIVDASRGIIRSLCNAYYISHEDRNDVFQDIVLQLWKSFGSFRGDSAVSTWVYRVSLNTILTRVRDEKRKIPTESIDSTDVTPVQALADDDGELLGIVLQSLEGLNKAIVILYLEGYGNAEIAGILDLTPTNVSTRLNRVKAQLKTKFKKQHHGSRQS